MPDIEEMSSILVTEEDIFLCKQMAEIVIKLGFDADFINEQLAEIKTKEQADYFLKKIKKVLEEYKEIVQLEIEL